MPPPVPFGETRGTVVAADRIADRQVPAIQNAAGLNIRGFDVAEVVSFMDLGG
jgi:hypothetical protein